MKTLLKTVLLAAFLLIVSCALATERQENYGFWEIQYHTGTNINNTRVLQEDFSAIFHSVDIRYGIQTYGQKEWQRYFKNPRYGFGFFRGYIGAEEIIGKPMALYTFIDFPILQKNRFSADIGLAGGMAFNLKPYHPVNNPRNDVIGSNLNAYLALAINANYRISARWDVIGGVNFAHVSNGKVEAPNLGFNLVGPTLGARYHFNQTKGEKQTPTNFRPPHFISEKPAFASYSELTIWGAMGSKKTKVERPRHSIYSGSIDWKKCYSPKGKYGLGVDVYYDGSLIEEFDAESRVSHWDQAVVGVHLGHELSVGNVGIISELGTYLLTKVTYDDVTYARIGLKYYATERVFAQVSLKTKGFDTADFIEWGLGFRLWRSPKTT